MATAASNVPTTSSPAKEARNETFVYTRMMNSTSKVATPPAIAATISSPKCNALGGGGVVPAGGWIANPPEIVNAPV